jgi:hypothetical protein
MMPMDIGELLVETLTTAGVRGFLGVVGVSLKAVPGANADSFGIHPAFVLRVI